jgi:hypothetical protein
VQPAATLAEPAPGDEALPWHKKRGVRIGGAIAAGLLAILLVVGVVALVSGGNGGPEGPTPQDLKAKRALNASKQLPDLVDDVNAAIDDLQSASRAQTLLSNLVTSCSNEALGKTPQDLDGLVACFDNLDAHKKAIETETTRVSELGFVVADAQKQLDRAKADPLDRKKVRAAVKEAEPEIENGERAVEIGRQMCDCDGRRAALLDQMRTAAVARDAGAYNSAKDSFNAENTTRNDLYDQLKEL